MRWSVGDRAESLVPGRRGRFEVWWSLGGRAVVETTARVPKVCAIGDAR